MSLIAGNLGLVQRLLDEHHVTWGVCAGAAAHLYGNRRPLQDVDLLVLPGKLAAVAQLLRQARKTVQFDGQRIIWQDIEIFDNLTIRRLGVQHPFILDAPMVARLRRMPLLGSPVPVLAPEDVLIHKLLLSRGADQGKYDLDDAAGIIRRQVLDSVYLTERMRLTNASPALRSHVETLGLRFEVA